MDFVNGVSASIIVYGQTGSGKTHTMFGDEHAPSAGVAPRAVEETFAAIAQRQRGGVRTGLQTGTACTAVERATLPGR